MKRRAFKPVNKYGAKRTAGYASKREAEYAAELALQKQAGSVAWWVEQVPVKLAGGIKYVVDFVVGMADGRTRFVEVKGYENAVWRMKMRLLEAERPEIYAMLEVVR